MIAHVAEAGEHRGRVVIRLDAAERPCRMALEAAVSVARAFGSEIESLFVEDDAVLSMAAYPFAREVALSGRAARGLSAPLIEWDFAVAASALMRQVEAAARPAEVRVHRRVIRDDPLDALARACAENGPWNVVALAGALRPGHARELKALFARGVDATGVVLAGPAAKRTMGPVAAIIEDVDRVAPTLRLAERLAAVTGGDVRILLVGETEERAADMEGQARLILDDTPRIGFGSAAASVGIRAMLDALRKIECGFLIAQFGGSVLPEDADLGPIAASLECPLFLVR